MNRDWNVRKLIRPKKEKRLPRYITPQQVAALLEAVSCEKHKLMMLLYYATGMRLSEVRMLKWEEVNFEEGIIFVKKGKGAKDRIVVLPAGLAQKLKAYRRIHRSTQQYVFEGKTPGKAIAARTIQWGFIRARQKAALPNWVTAHVMRHSFATASLKNGADVLTLKELLGHNALLEFRQVFSCFISLLLPMMILLISFIFRGFTQKTIDKLLLLFLAKFNNNQRPNLYLTIFVFFFS